MAIISYGRMNKKLFLIIFLITIRTIYKIVMNEVPDDYSDGNLNALEEDLGTIILGVILHIIFKQKISPLPIGCHALSLLMKNRPIGSCPKPIWRALMDG